MVGWGGVGWGGVGSGGGGGSPVWAGGGPGVSDVPRAAERLGLPERPHRLELHRLAGAPPLPPEAGGQAPASTLASTCSRRLCSRPRSGLAPSTASTVSLASSRRLCLSLEIIYFIADCLCLPPPPPTWLGLGLPGSLARPRRREAEEARGRVRIEIVRTMHVCSSFPRFSSRGDARDQVKPTCVSIACP